MKTKVAEFMALSLKSGLVTREKEQAQAHRKHEGEVWGIDSNACVDDSRSQDSRHDSLSNNKVVGVNKRADRAGGKREGTATTRKSAAKTKTTFRTN